jgi:chemotaxis protein methyltransferase CheR
MEEQVNNIYKQEMTKDDFTRLSNSIYRICGISLPEVKKTLIEGRIRKRMKQLEIKTYNSYINYLFSDSGTQNEIIPFIDSVTTNKTDFFRESVHFDYLTDTILPELTKLDKKKGWKKPLLFWSAGCSTGEEPYTLAIVLNEFRNINCDYQFEIFASDISTEVLSKASMGIFEMEKTDVIPIELKKKYLLKSKDPIKPMVRFISELRNQIQFLRINFMDDNYDLPDNLDIVFCRNVLIYFDKTTQEKVLKKIIHKMRSGGYLFLGHSETIMGMELTLKRVASTIYRKN